jgi:RIO-like serine/threonine protein kinase
MAGASESPFQDVEVSKMLLGDNGIAMLRAIRFGPVDVETIQALSGLPKACIEGRLPVLAELDMVKEISEGFLLKQAGIDFLEAIGNNL